MAEIKSVKGAESGTPFHEDQIWIDSIYAKMRAEPLLNEDDEIVIPVRSQETPHFRRLGLGKGFQATERKEPSKKHTEVIVDLFKRLESEKNNIEMSTYVFLNKKEVWVNAERGREIVSQILFRPVAASTYAWYRENRIRFDDGTYIQPDLCGRDTKTMTPGAFNPGIIIEVIDSHPPEPATLSKLMKLSMCAHHVYFFFITSDQPYNSQYLNSVKKGKARASLRFTYALIGGELIVNGEPVQLDSESFDGRCGEILVKLDQVVSDRPTHKKK
ncbi:hypothetical protein [Xanthomonas axonopodis]|uniref:hypothetical protein n=1 Tax=Xanthomonas axonopodis TaxID=53413 RepID=UPI0035562B4A